MAGLHALFAVGTRPEAIKLAPVIDECRRRADVIRLTTCFTGQHRELVQPVAEYFGIQTDVDLAVMVEGQSLAALTGSMLSGLDSVIERFMPDCVVAQGDTTSVLCAALAAFYRRVPLVHVEAGLRTGDLSAPWPEEMNRRVATLATALHCAPTNRARRNLLAEGVVPQRIAVTGNTVVDALLATVKRERDQSPRWDAKYPMLAGRKIVLITGHRRENHGDGLRAICSAVSELSKRFSGVAFLFPVHLNPHVRHPVRQYLAGHENIFLLPPVPYPEFVWLMDRSTLIVTDSGGVQEEAPSLGKPVLVTRACTERPEAVECGLAKVVGTNVDAIVREASKVLDGAVKPTEAGQSPYGDGSASQRIVDAMLAQFAMT